MKVLVIIPAYNEELNIKNTCASLDKIKDKLDFQLDYIVINDGSKDNTEKVCLDNGIPLISLANNLGIGGAVQTGYKHALKNKYDIAIQFDGDGQHDANYIKDLVNPIKEKKFNMVVGSRYISDLSEFKSTAIRQFGISVLSFILKMVTGKKIYDITSGFRAVNKDIIKIFASDYPSDYPEPESLVAVIKRGYKVKEVPVKMHERKFGTSSITPLKSIYYMIKVSYAMIVRSFKEKKKKQR